MKNFNAFIILILTFLNSEQLRGDEIDNDVTNLRKIFNELQNDTDFLSKKVFIDDKEVSIFDYLKSSNPAKSIDSSAIIKENVYELSHLINIVLSCEYSEILYYYIVLIDKCFSECITTLNDDKSNNENAKLSIVNKCFDNYHTHLLDHVSEQIQSMILSLVSLQKFTKNVVFKYHDILRILLSWYAYIQTHLNTKSTNEQFSEKMLRLDSIIITNFQMKKRLERFLITYCKRPEELILFLNNFDTNVTKLDDFIKYDNLVKSKDTKLKWLTYRNFDNVQKKFVLNPLYSNFDDLITLLINTVPSKTLQINWNNNVNGIKEVFESYIKNNIDIATILQYEKILQNVIFDIILWHEIKLLTKITRYKENVDKLNECNNLFNKINNFTTKIKNNDQSIVLIHKMVKIKNRLSVVCNWLKSYEKNKKHVDHEIIKMKNSYTNEAYICETESYDETKFGEFLLQLSGMSIYAKLHPSISNTFWEHSIVYSSSSIGNYGTNYQYLHTAYKKQTVNNFLCSKTKEISTQLDSIEEEVKKCINTDRDNNSVSTNDSCFTAFNLQYDKVIIDIAHISVNTYTEYFDDWARMLLTLYHNKKNIELFDPDKQKSLNVTSIQYLITFIYIMKNIFLENQYVTCSCGVFSSLDNIGSCPDGQWIEESESQSDMWNDYIKNVDNLKIESKLEGLFSYEKSVQSITVRVKKLLHDFKSNVEFKLYWDGTKKNLEEVNTSYKMHTIDIQDAYDYGSFFVRWGIVLINSRLMKILNIMIKHSYELPESKINKLDMNVKKFMDVDLLEHTPVKYHLQDFLHAISLQTVNHNIEETKQVKNEMSDAIKFFGSVEVSLPDENETNLDLIDNLLSDIVEVKMAFNEKVDPL